MYEHYHIGPALLDQHFVLDETFTLLGRRASYDIAPVELYEE